MLLLLKCSKYNLHNHHHHHYYSNNAGVNGGTTAAAAEAGGVDAFLTNFSTCKVRSLVALLRSHHAKADEFCCMLLVHNKQVATSLCLLMRKLAKEDNQLAFISVNYIIGSSAQQQSSQHNSAINHIAQADDENGGGGGGGTAANDTLKQEDILRKFYAGEINLLICTYEMEEKIHAPTCVNLIVRFDCFDGLSLAASAVPPMSGGSTDGVDYSSNTSSSSSNYVNGSSASSSSLLNFDYFAYIGTKARARSPHASCQFFVEQRHFDAFFRQFVRFKQIETSLRRNYSLLVAKNEKILNAAAAGAAASPWAAQSYNSYSTSSS